MRQINAPDVVCGVHSMYLRNRKTEDKLVLDKMAKEAEKLIEVNKNNIFLDTCINVSK